MHSREPSFRDTQFQKEISFERQSLCERCLHGVPDETFDISNRFRRVRSPSTRDLHRAIESLAADCFVHQALPFGFTRIECFSHEYVHQSSRHSNGARQPLGPTGTGKETNLCLRKSDQVFAVFSDTKVARQCKLESASQGRAGNSGDYWFWHALAQSHGLVEESPIVGRIFGPLAAGSPQGLGDLDKRGNIKITIEITGRTSGQHNYATIHVTLISF